MVQKIDKSKLSKILTISYIVLVVPLMVLLVLSNINSFVDSTNRFKDIFDLINTKTYFDNEVAKSSILYDEIILEIINDISLLISNIEEFFNNVDGRWKSFEAYLSSFFDSFCDFLIYFCNIGINAIMVVAIYFNETFNATQLDIKTNIFAKAYLFICKIIGKIFHIFSNSVKWILRKLYDFRRFIALNILLCILSNGIFYKILVEIIIFAVVYVYKTIMEECYLVIFSMFQWLIIKLYPVVKSIPTWCYIPIIIVVVFMIAVSKAEYRLEQNHTRLKKLVKDDLTQTTFINGPPGSGKTLLNVSLSLASEEVFIETLESMLLDHELKYPYYNFANIRLNNSFENEHKSYFDNYKTLTSRNSYIISNYAIYSPYFNDYSKIFDFNFMRKNLKSDKYALEEYTVISISELDKEYNSHDDMKRVGSDGAATFFSTVSHDLKRHVKIFCDYQLKDQVPLRIRGNSEYFYTIESRKKKYPFLLGLYYLPIRGIAKLLRSLIKRYETRRDTINKYTKRRTISTYKRNDISALYIILRQLALVFNKISNWFDHYWYFRITGNLSMQDGLKGEPKNILLNICDLSISNMALYDSTFLSYAYEEKKNMAFKDLDRFKSLTPSIDDLTKCNSHFYNVLNGIETNELVTSKDDDNEDYIIINN